MRRASIIVAIVCIAAAATTSVNHAERAARKVDFTTEVQPILRQHCISCHGPIEQKNGFRLDRRADAMRGGTIAVIGPGNSEGSRLYQRLIGAKFGPQMPPTGSLPASQIETIKTWIDQGAVWPDAVSGEDAVAPPDPAATEILDAFRSGDRARAKSLVAAHAEVLNKKGRDGKTPLMFATLYGHVADVKDLLTRGADPNVADEGEVTPLMWAVTDLEKTKALIDAGADVNAMSADGRTPLLIAAGIPGAAPVTRLLLDRGAKLTVKAPGLIGETTPLLQALYSGDEETFHLLVSRGADVVKAGFPALGLSMRAQCDSCVGTMLKHLGADQMTPTMILAAPPFGPALATNMLLERGADINARDPEGRTILMLAAASEAVPVDVVRTLIARGADVNAKSAAGDSALTFARMRGETEITKLLIAAGASDPKDAPAPKLAYAPAASPRAALTRTLPLLQQTDKVFMKKAACVSCHNNTLTAMTVSLARTGGVRINEQIASHQKAAIAKYLESWKDRVLQGIGIPGDATTVSYILVGLAAEKYPADASTDAMARFLLLQQRPAGFWLPLGHRPPIEGDLAQVTAVSMRALQMYAPKVDREKYTEAIDRAAKWLAATNAPVHEGQVFQILGLHWSGGDRALLKAKAQSLLSAQRGDGGWAQLPSLQSDAYATGQALVALVESGAITVRDPAYQRGVQFLLRTQLADGSWFVKSRSLPIQPHFEAGFPFGKDQFISAAGTNWAAMALAHAMRMKS